MDNERWDPNAEVICPYDDTHVLTVQRFQRHLVKCRKNHPDKDFVTCPFNAKHLFLRADLKSHLCNCPDRTLIDREIIQAECPETGEMLRLRGNTSMPKPNNRLPDPDEDWDVEIEENVEKREEYVREQLSKFTCTGVRPLRQPKVSPNVLRQPNVSPNVNTGKTNCKTNKSTYNSFCIGDDSEVESIQSDSSRSSLYVVPVKYSKRSDVDNKPAASAQAPNEKYSNSQQGGRGVESDESVGKITSNSFGRGSLNLTIRKFQLS